MRHTQTCANQSNEDGFSQGHLSLTNARPWKKASFANDQRPDWLPRAWRSCPSSRRRISACTRCRLSRLGCPAKLGEDTRKRV
jgi:hypothetical protein